MGNLLVSHHDHNTRYASASFLKRHRYSRALVEQEVMIQDRDRFKSSVGLEALLSGRWTLASTIEYQLHRHKRSSIAY